MAPLHAPTGPYSGLSFYMQISLVSVCLFRALSLVRQVWPHVCLVFSKPSTSTGSSHREAGRSQQNCLGFLRNTILIQSLTVFKILLGETLLRLFQSKHRLLPHHSFPAYCPQMLCHAPD